MSERKKDRQTNQEKIKINGFITRTKMKTNKTTHSDANIYNTIFDKAKTQMFTKILRGDYLIIFKRLLLNGSTLKFKIA